MEEPEELEPMRKIDEIRRFSNKEMRLTEESMGALPKSIENRGPIKKKSYSYVPKSDKRVEFGLGFSDELLRTSLMVVWELMRPSWCPNPNADSILRATQYV